MKFLHKTTVAIVALLAWVGAAAQNGIKIDNVYYNLSGTRATIVPPPDGTQYTGNFTLVPTVEYNGNTYDVSASLSSFRNSTITTLTVATGWEGHGSGTMQFREITTLKRIDLLSCSGSYTDNGYSRMHLNVGNNPNLVYVSTLITGDSTKVHVDKFEVYGPDGSKLQPFLLVDGTGERIYPDADGSFILNKDFRTQSGDYCGVLIMGNGSGDYNIALLNVEVNGIIQTIRTEPAQAQGATIVKAGDIFVKNWIGGAIVVAAPEGYEYPVNTIVPQTVEIDGSTVNVTNIDPETFVGTKMKSISLQCNFDGYKNVYITDCPNLESVEWTNNNCRMYLRSNPLLSEIKFPASEDAGYGTVNNCDAITTVDIPAGTTKFGITYTNCKNLSSVNIPSSVVELEGFYNCPKLTELNLPSSIKQLNNLRHSYLSSLAIPSGMSFGDGALNDAEAGLIDVEVLESAEEYVKVRVNSHITDMDGNVLPLAALPYFGSYREGNNSIVVPDEDGIMTLKRSTTIGTSDAMVNRYAFCYDASKGNYTVGLSPETVADRDAFSDLLWLTMQMPSVSTGVTEVEVADENAPVEYYNLQGVRVAEPENGLYIVKQGNKVSKKFIR